MAAWTVAHPVALVTGLGVRPGGIVDVDLVDVGPARPKMEHRTVILTPTPSPGEQGGERTVHGFQALTRWGPFQPVEAHEAAAELHRLLTRAAFPIWVGDVYVLGVTGPPPVPLGDPADDGDRTTYVATYLATVIEYDSSDQ